MVKQRIFSPASRRTMFDAATVADRVVCVMMRSDLVRAGLPETGAARRSASSHRVARRLRTQAIAERAALDGENDVVS